MKPSLRLTLGKSPFRVTLAIPVEDLISGIASLFTSTIAQEDPSTKALDNKYHHVIAHDGGEVDIQPCTDEEAVVAMQKTLSLMDLKNPKLYRVDGEQRILLTGGQDE